ncbi:MAG: metal-dependent hydrolase [Euryarchaeota archaeon]|nr:metal-dependent hydrolase [Euryarchaeota archaeon]
MAHGLIAWLIALLLVKNINDRRLLVIVGVAADLDGIFIFFDQNSYFALHHTFGHSYVFGILIVLIAALLAKEKLMVGLGAFLAFSAHLFCDVIGSNWSITPLFPLSDMAIGSTGYLPSEVIYSLINPLALLILVLVVIAVGYRKEISPFEFISAKLDKMALGAFIYPFKYKCEYCGKWAFGECEQCKKKICAQHLPSFYNSKCSICSDSQLRN